jgi:hypothetical protein
MGSDMEREQRHREAFERLWLLRRCYSLRSDYDRRSAMTVADAILHGEHLMRISAVGVLRRERRRVDRTA